jgi:hypothetical protein
MGRAFVYVVLGGGVAAGYAAREFARRGGYSRGELCIISEEAVSAPTHPFLPSDFARLSSALRNPLNRLLVDRAAPLVLRIACSPVLPTVLDKVCFLICA